MMSTHNKMQKAMAREPALVVQGFYGGCLTVHARSVCESFLRRLFQLTTPTNFTAATPIVGCALLRIAHAFHCQTQRRLGKQLLMN